MLKRQSILGRTYANDDLDKFALREKWLVSDQMFLNVCFFRIHFEETILKLGFEWLGGFVAYAPIRQIWTNSRTRGAVPLIAPDLQYFTQID